MSDLILKIDRLAEINDEMSKLKNEKSKLEADIIKKCSADLANTKLKSQKYESKSAELTATNAESLKITYTSFLPFIFGKAYPDAITESKSYKVSAAATRMIIGIWQGNYVENTVADVIEQMNLDSESSKQLLKKCKGKNYQKDIANIQKFTDMSYEDAAEWAYLMTEAEIWQSFTNMLQMNDIDVSDKALVNDIINKIRAAFVVEETTKIAVSRLGDEDA